MILAQANLDASIATLLSRVRDTYVLILENKSSSEINATKDVLVQIAQIIRECAFFISQYSDTKSFCRPPLYLFLFIGIHLLHRA